MPDVLTAELLSPPVLTAELGETKYIGEGVPEQTIEDTITQNGVKVYEPDAGKVLSKATVNVDVPSDRKPEETTTIEITENGDGQEFIPTEGKVSNKIKANVHVISMFDYVSGVNIGTNINLFSSEDLTIYGKNIYDLGEVYRINGYNNRNKKNHTVKHLTIKSDVEVTNMASAFNHDNWGRDNFMERITLDFNCSDTCGFYNSPFFNFGALKIIDGIPINLKGSAQQGILVNSNVSCLEEIRIKENSNENLLKFEWFPNLSKDSVVSAVKGCNNNVTEQTLTLSKIAVDRDFETSVGANDGSESSEWLALIADRSNWTISLV